MAAKTIDLLSRQQVRHLAGKLMEEWQDAEAVAEALGCYPVNVRRWYSEYRQKGTAGEAAYKEPGRPPKLTPHQQAIVQDLVFAKTPREMNQEAALWSNTAIRQVIRELFRIDLTLGTVNSMTRKMGIVRRHFFRQTGPAAPPELADWLKHRFPLIRKLAKGQKASLFFVHGEKFPDSAAGSANPDAVGASPPGRRDALAAEVRMLSAICPRNSQRFMIFRGPFNAEAFIRFIEGMLHDVDRHLFVIAAADYKPMALEADHFLSSVLDRLTLFFLPPDIVVDPSDPPGE